MKDWDKEQEDFFAEMYDRIYQHGLKHIHEDGVKVMRIRLLRIEFKEFINQLLMNNKEFTKTFIELWGEYEMDVANSQIEESRTASWNEPDERTKTLDPTIEGFIKFLKQKDE